MPAGVRPDLQKEGRFILQDVMQQIVDDLKFLGDNHVEE
jgi:hypothetical protein